MKLSFLATEIRSIGQFHSTFAVMSTDFDLSMQIQSSSAKLWKLRVNVDWELFLFSLPAKCHSTFTRPLSKILFSLYNSYMYLNVCSSNVCVIEMRKYRSYNLVQYSLRHIYVVYNFKKERLTAWATIFFLWMLYAVIYFMCTHVLKPLGEGAGGGRHDSYWKQLLMNCF